MHSLFNVGDVFEQMVLYFNITLVRHASPTNSYGVTWIRSIPKSNFWATWPNLSLTALSVTTRNTQYTHTHTHTHTHAINAEAALFLPVHCIASICIHIHKQPQQSKTRTVLYGTNTKSNGCEIFISYSWLHYLALRQSIPLTAQKPVLYFNTV
jgi:hypothetical protein